MITLFLIIATMIMVVKGEMKVEKWERRKVKWKESEKFLQLLGIIMKFNLNSQSNCNDQFPLSK